MRLHSWTALLRNSLACLVIFGSLLFGSGPSWGEALQSVPLSAVAKDAIARVERENPPGSKELAEALRLLWLELLATERPADAFHVGMRLLNLRLSMLGTDDIEVADTYSALSSLAGRLNLHQDSLTFILFALEINERAASAGRVNQLSRALHRAGETYDDLGNYKEALALLSRSLELAERERRIPLNVAETQTLLAGVHRTLGNYTSSQELYRKAIEVFDNALGPQFVNRQSLQEGSATAPLDVWDSYHRHLVFLSTNARRGLAKTLIDQKRYELAEAQYKESFFLTQNLLGAEHEFLAPQLIDIGGLYCHMARYDDATRVLQAALRGLRANPRATQVSFADALQNLGLVHLATGNAESALDYFKRAFAIYQETKGRAIYEAQILNSMGIAYESLGKEKSALSAYQISLRRLSNELGPEHPHVAALLNNLGAFKANVKDSEGALESIRKGVDIRMRAFGASSPITAPSLVNLATLHREAGNLNAAVAALLTALSSQINVESADETLWKIQDGLMRSYSAGSPEVAIFWGKQTLNSLQALRFKNSGLDASVNRRFVQIRTSPYVYLADLLINQGRELEAQQVLELLKEKELFDDVTRNETSSTRPVDQTTVELQRARRLLELQRRQGALDAEQRDLERVARERLSPQAKQRLAQILKERSGFEQDLSEFMATLQADLRFDRQAQGGTRYDVVATQSRLNRVVEILGTSSGVVALQYLIADSRLSILMTVPGESKPRTYVVPIDYSTLRDQLLSFSRDLRDPSRLQNGIKRGVPLTGELGLQPQARKLYDVLIGPVEAPLRDVGARTLMLSLTDVLRLVPFAALRAPARGALGERYFIEDYALSLYNEAGIDKDSLAQATRLPKRAWKVAGFGLSEAVDGMVALTSVDSELKGVAGPERQGSQYWLNKNFSLSRLTSSLNGDFDVIHLASHYALNAADMQSSKLYLGDGSKLTLKQLSESSMRFDGIEFVALSACATGASGRDSSGQELESLAAAIQRRKAAAVLATLWPVADASTAEAMKLFYFERDVASGTLPTSKAQALRAVQLSMIRGGRGGAAEWSNPFYWAPFVILGNWR